MPGQRTSSCSRTWKKIQPGSTGIQCVANRYARTAATAGPDVIPNPVRPATSAASLAPSLGPFGSGPEGDVAGPALRPPSREASCRRGGRRCDRSGRRASQPGQRRRRPARVVSQRRLAAGAADARAGRTVPPPHPGPPHPSRDVGLWQGAIRDPGDPYPRSSSPRSLRMTDPPPTSSTATTRAASVPSLASPSHRSKTAICSHRRVTGTSISAIPLRSRRGHRRQLPPMPGSSAHPTKYRRNGRRSDAPDARLGPHGAASSGAGARARRRPGRLDRSSDRVVPLRG
jgi:hypothetical protein